MKALTPEQRSQTACEATLLLNEALRELVIPRRIFALTENVPEAPVDMLWLEGVATSCRALSWPSIASGRSEAISCSSGFFLMLSFLPCSSLA